MNQLPNCPVETTLLFLTNRWRVLIIRDLMSGKKRFGELKKSVGSISQKVLTENLKAMEQYQLLTRTAYPEVPPRVEYELTEIGYSLAPVLESLSDWGHTYQTKNKRV
ncbi:winged helix-turn-helix transcriptional regulator [Enterococcus italicus]|jgi:DNA-binding HxlR family transcriptional regulator|uniref:Transcriptional regulator, HxlR family n=1 Tax=Enterococcus italicus (strain DSM 15952 / CCUG 50447 / LMG 22039 / TP 1.5) TaxID=888064 RepID=E6LCS1_ENTI1|nr:helix-turn-helix domain-containing protein [Enterococcus italicus]EFU75113.1 transcriptional regulator, HxlR family [Enterococcus italicus DSM 15952]MDN6004994.1 helix-turn-helix transcriptional regulator [Enterococcus sp.]OJG61415.1 MarR family transcriptional regulator [Enterococcus italicus DSM 15952]